jgi:hypothetical protein
MREAEKERKKHKREEKYPRKLPWGEAQIE